MLISDEYRELNRKLHETCPIYGSKGDKGIAPLLEMIEKYRAVSALDYGSGKGGLKRCFNKRGVEFTLREYEPAFGIDERSPSDIVICRDVLEHIEPECIDDVLTDIRGLTLKCFWSCIALSPSRGEFLADGRNTHILLRSADWWRKKIGGLFRIQNYKGGSAITIEATT